MKDEHDKILRDFEGYLEGFRNGPTNRDIASYMSARLEEQSARHHGIFDIVSRQVMNQNSDLAYLRRKRKEEFESIAKEMERLKKIPESNHVAVNYNKGLKDAASVVRARTV